MAKKKRPVFIENELIGDHLIQETILNEALPEIEPIEPFRDHPERPQPGGRSGATGKVNRPPRTDPRHADQSVLPGHRDVPAGTERPARTPST